MARLNSLFPAEQMIQKDLPLESAICSPGLRDCIRFSVYEHLMTSYSCSQRNRNSLSKKLNSWCDIAEYTEAQNSLVRYFEEFKKLEEICLGSLPKIEMKYVLGLNQSDSCQSSFATSSDIRKSIEILPARATSTTDTPDTGHMGDKSMSSSISSKSESIASVPSGYLTPLLRGMPGREISASKTDGAAFAADCGAPDLFSYPEDLSKTEFYMHPLAADLNLTLEDMARLGLIIPKERSSRDF